MYVCMYVCGVLYMVHVRNCPTQNPAVAILLKLKYTPLFAFRRGKLPAAKVRFKNNINLRGAFVLDRQLHEKLFVIISKLYN